MNSFITIISGLGMFLFLITIHELGHFIGAKLSGIRVNEFSIGMGPSIFKKQGPETLYSLRLLPIGGYVMMEGEESDSDDERSYNNAAAWKRFITIFAGPFVNFLFAVIIFFSFASFNGFQSLTVSEVSKDYPAYTAGIRIGDKIEKVNDKSVYTFQEAVNKIASTKENIKISVLRDKELLNFDITPKTEDGLSVIGIKTKIENSFLENIKYSINMTYSMSKMILESLGSLFTGKIGVDQLSGPVGVVKQVGESLNYGLRGFLMFSAMISVNLGLFNLLPIPALDGSKLLFNLFEMITGKRANRKLEERITIIGFIFLLSLMLLISVKDVLNLFK